MSPRIYLTFRRHLHLGSQRCRLPRVTAGPLDHLSDDRPYSSTWFGCDIPLQANRPWRRKGCGGLDRRAEQSEPAARGGFANVTSPGCPRVLGFASESRSLPGPGPGAPKGCRAGRAGRRVGLAVGDRETSGFGGDLPANAPGPEEPSSARESDLGSRAAEGLIRSGRKRAGKRSRPPRSGIQAAAEGYQYAVRCRGTRKAVDTRIPTSFRIDQFSI